MSENSKNKRLAKNTIYLYVRMLFAVCINLYTSRLVLECLGVEDFGIYNIVGGVVWLMMFVNASMRGATSRFITFCLGKNNVNELKATISSAIQVHVIIALLLLLIGETVGLWFVRTELNIPETSMNAANWVYQFSLFSSVISILQVPFNASVLAYEKMDVFAIIEMVNVLLKCLIVFCIVWFPDRLIAYGGLMLVVSIIVSLMYVLYSFFKLEGFAYSSKFHRKIVNEMVLFAACDLYGNGTFAVKQQGINILINKFFGVAYNAASGVATQASSIISTFMNNILSAFRPQIIKEYSVGNINRMSKLMYSECEILILLIGLIFVPLYINMDFIMQLWLKNTPNYAVDFCRILLIFNAVSVVTQVLQDGIFATGKIKKTSIVVGNLNLLCLVLVYVFFIMGLDATFAYYAMLLFLVFQTLVNSYILNSLIRELKVYKYLIKTVKPFTIVFVSFIIQYLCGSYIFSQWMKLLGCFLLNSLIIIVAALMIYPKYRSVVSLYMEKFRYK